MSAENLSKVINLLSEKGFCASGKTRAESVKFVTVNSYPFAGKVATFGGRERFELPETDWKVTVGKRTVYFYQSGKGAAAGGQQFQTRDLEEITNFVENLVN